MANEVYRIKLNVAIMVRMSILSRSLHLIRFDVSISESDSVKAFLHFSSPLFWCLSFFGSSWFLFRRLLKEIFARLRVVQCSCVSSVFDVVRSLVSVYSTLWKVDVSVWFAGESFSINSSKSLETFFMLNAENVNSTNDIIEMRKLPKLSLFRCQEPIRREIGEKRTISNPPRLRPIWLDTSIQLMIGAYVIHWLIHSLIHLLIYSLVYSYSFIHSFI